MKLTKAGIPDHVLDSATNNRVKQAITHAKFWRVSLSVHKDLAKNERNNEIGNKRKAQISKCHHVIIPNS